MWGEAFGTVWVLDLCRAQVDGRVTIGWRHRREHAPDQQSARAGMTTTLNMLKPGALRLKMVGFVCEGYDSEKGSMMMMRMRRGRPMIQ
jgi:hypothetical protein